MTVDVLIPALTIVKTASTSVAVPGTVVGYTITVTDTGQTSYTGAVVTDDLTGVLDDAAYNGDAAATAGSVSYAAPHLTWTGNLAPGAAGDHHLLGHRQQPRHRRQDAHQRRRPPSDGGQHLPAGQRPTPPATVTIAVLTPALTIVKTASAATAVPGQTVHVHHHRDRLRADPLHRGDGHR